MTSAQALVCPRLLRVNAPGLENPISATRTSSASLALVQQLGVKPMSKSQRQETGTTDSGMRRSAFFTDDAR